MFVNPSTLRVTCIVSTLTLPSAATVSQPTVGGMVTPVIQRSQMLFKSSRIILLDDEPTVLRCTACSRAGILHTWQRFPTLRWCHDCIRKMQYQLYLTCGFIPPLPFLVLDNTWKTGPNNHTMIPPGIAGILQASQAYSTRFDTRGTRTRS